MTKNRFAFGKNWQYFLAHINDSKIRRAEDSLRNMLGLESLEGMRFLDAGCGSGLFSLAALRLGAKEVVSFDYDADSVRCADELNRRYGVFDHWKIKRGDILDPAYLAELGKFDIVYSWGVIHHTGAMWTGLKNIITPVGAGGRLFIAIYNDEGKISRAWTVIKRFYVASPHPVRFLIAALWYSVVIIVRTLKGIFRLQPPSNWYEGSERGMSLWYDAVDWVGGYPFETASADELLHFYQNEGFTATQVKIKRGSGCHEIVFQMNP